MRTPLIAKTRYPRGCRHVLGAPPRHVGVVAAQQHIRHAPAAKLAGARVLRILRAALEIDGKRLADDALGIAHGAGYLAHDGVERRHGGDLAAAEHVRADGDTVRDQVGDALVDALVASAQQAEVTLRELARQRVVELAPLGRQLDDAPSLAHRRAVDPIHRLERGGHHVDAQDHAGAAAIRRVVDLQVLERRVVAVVPHRDVRAELSGASHVDLARVPREGGREQREDIEFARGSLCSHETSQDP